MKSANHKSTGTEERPKEHRQKNCCSIDEVAKIFNIDEWTIRLWINRFDILKPRLNKKGALLFTPDDVEIIETICRLSKQKGMTLNQAKKHLENY